MSASQSHKDTPLSLRMARDDLAMIDTAARIKGRSRTEFIRDVAVREAEDIIMETRPIRMDDEAFAHFLAIMAAPAEPVPEMVSYMSRPAPWDQH